MKTTVNNSTVNAKSTYTPATGKTEAGTAVQSKINNLPVSKQFDGASDKAGNAEPVKTTQKPVQHKEQGSPEVSKSEIKEQLKQEKPVLNLEGTLKLVEELHRRKIQRDKLLSTIGALEEFEVTQQDDAEETDGNHFQGCELTIQDDKRREFSTKNPYIIKKVAEYINTLCVDRLAEIESGIYIPS